MRSTAVAASILERVDKLRGGSDVSVRSLGNVRYEIKRGYFEIGKGQIGGR